MPEFVNPKYADAARTSFKSPTRLECMMQDFPWVLPQGSAVGFTCLRRGSPSTPRSRTPSPEAIAAHEKGVFAASPGAGEAAVYECNARILRYAGAAGGGGASQLTFLGLPLALGPAIALTPNFALTVDGAIRRCPGGERGPRLGALAARARRRHRAALRWPSTGRSQIQRVPRRQRRRARLRRQPTPAGPFQPVEPGSPPKAVSIRGYAVGDRAGGSARPDHASPGGYELSGSGELRKL